MKVFKRSILIVLGMMLVACGIGSPDTIDGDWTATLSGAQVLKFSVTLNQAVVPDVDITNFTFTTPAPCFDSSHSQSSTFTSSGIVNGNITGPFTLDIGTLFPEQTQNELHLEGNVVGKTISGTWTLTGGVGTGCNVDSGNFKMIKN